MCPTKKFLGRVPQNPLRGVLNPEKGKSAQRGIENPLGKPATGGGKRAYLGPKKKGPFEKGGNINPRLQKGCPKWGELPCETP